MSRSNRQVFTVEDDYDDPYENYTRKPSKEEFLPSNSKKKSARDFPSFKSEALGKSSAKSKCASFVQTPKGLVIVTLCVLVGGLGLSAGLAALMYHLGTSLNSRVVSPTVNATSPSVTNPISMDTVILTQQEQNNLISLGGFRSFFLLYRASRDGFFANVFHRLCDPRTQTVSVIRSHVNSVFGGYTAQTWNLNNAWKTDATAFLFSLRRRGIANAERFNVTSPSNAIYARTDSGPIFGSGHDFIICENSDISQCSTSNYCSAYQCPTGASLAMPTWYLAGVTPFNTTEIEVFQVTF